MRFRSCFIILLAVSLLLPGAASAELTDAVVKVFVTSSSPEYYRPWSNQGQNRSTGSGCIISGNRILTNAHVVNDATFIQVLRNGHSRRYKAEVVAVSHEADLAMLKVADEAFYKGVKPLKIGGLPEMQEEVLVYGFPKGGETLSVTKGVVSRIEMRGYAHSQMALLSVQIDAAINSGNSGGPVIRKGKIAGIAMQTLNNAENIGNIIPVPVIEHFLTDMKDGVYNGFPLDGFITQEMNDTLNRYAGLPEDGQGTYIFYIFPGTSADSHLKPGDVLLEIDGRPIANDETVLLRKGLRVNYDHFVKVLQIGETLNLKIWRDGKELAISYPLTSRWREHGLVAPPMYDTKPQYMIYGGLVFAPLTVNLIREWGDNWYNDAPTLYLYQHFYGLKSRPDEEVVILNSVLGSEINAGYDEYSTRQIIAVNGKSFTTFRQFVDLVDSFANEKYINFTIDRGEMVVVSVADHKRELNNILKRYNISKDRHLNGK